MIDWFHLHGAETTGAIAGLVYIFLSIRQKIWLWPVGMLTSAIYVYVFTGSRLYADAAINVYYVAISLYGWYYWISGRDNRDDKLPVKVSSQKLVITLTAITIILYAIILWGLLYLPQKIDIPASELPYLDAFTTALSITATWMLARKLIGNWILWIIIDAVSLFMYIYKELYATSILFLVYTVMAVIGYREWKKTMQHA